MFSSLTSYLFGSTNEPTATEAETAAPSDVNGKDGNQDLRIRSADNEWVLVEKSRSRRTHRSTSRTRQGDPVLECSLGPLFKSSELTNVLSPSSRRQSGDILDSSLCMSLGLGYHSDNDVVSDDATESDISSVPEPMVYPSMEESWLVTPPACFTAGSSRMETSSLENLLIEHPSMSVYSHRGRQSSAGDDSDDALSDDGRPTEASTQTTQSRRPHAGLARHEPSRRPGALSARADLVKVKTVKAMQRSQQRRVHKDLARSRVLRSNKVRDVQSSNRRGGVRHQVLNQPRAHRSSQY